MQQEKSDAQRVRLRVITEPKTFYKTEMLKSTQELVLQDSIIVEKMKMESEAIRKRSKIDGNGSEIRLPTAEKIKHQINKHKTMAKAQEEEEFISGLNRKMELEEKVAKNVESDLENLPK